MLQTGSIGALAAFPFTVRRALPSWLQHILYKPAKESIG